MFRDNKKIIIIVLIALVFLFIAIINNSNKNIVLVCSSNVTLIDGEAFEKYTFYGKNEIVERQELFVEHYIIDKDLIDEYKKIIGENDSCSDISIYEDYISYDCNYDLVDSNYYDDLETKDGKLLFTKIKEEFEANNFVCSYK